MTVIRELLVKLAYSLDSASEARVKKSVDAATKGAQQIGQAEQGLTKEQEKQSRERARIAEREAKEIERHAEAVGRNWRPVGAAIHKTFVDLPRLVGQATLAINGMAAGVFGAVTLTAKGLDELNHASNRTNTSVRDIQAFQTAFSNLGGSGQQALGILENVQGALRANPNGLGQWLQVRGVDPNTDGLTRLQGVARILRQSPQQRAILEGGLLGLSPEDVRLLRSGEFERRLEKARDLQREVGVTDAQIANATKFTEQWRDFGDILTAIRQRAAGGIAGEWATSFRDFNEYVKANAGAISDALTKIGTVIGQVGSLFVRWLGQEAGPLLTRFSGWLKEIEPREITKWFTGAATSLGKFRDALIEVKDAIVGVHKSLEAIANFVGGGGNALSNTLREAESLRKFFFGSSAQAAPGGASGAGGGGEAGGVGTEAGSGPGKLARRNQAAAADTRTWYEKILPKALGGKDAPAGGGEGGTIQAPGAPGTYRPVYKLGPRDTSDPVINTIAGEARMKDPASVDAVINNMFNRLGTRWGGVANSDLHAVARAPGQYEGYRKATEKEAELIRERISAIASGSVPDITKGANTFRASGYGGPSSPWWRNFGQFGQVHGGNRYAYDPSVPNGPYGSYKTPQPVMAGAGSTPATSGWWRSPTTDPNDPTLQGREGSHPGPGASLKGGFDPSRFDAVNGGGSRFDASRFDMLRTPPALTPTGGPVSNDNSRAVNVGDTNIKIEGGGNSDELKAGLERLIKRRNSDLLQSAQGAMR